MKKILLLAVFLCSFGLMNLTATTVGVISTVYGNSGAWGGTLSVDRLEFELGISGLLNDTLSLGVDYNLVDDGFAIGSANNFFWNFAIGSSLFVKTGTVNVSIIAPFELGFRFPVFASGIDLYLQFKPAYGVVGASGFKFYVDLGVRVRL